MNQVEAQVLLDMIEGQINYHSGWISSYNLLKNVINNQVTVVNTPLQETISQLQAEKDTLLAEKEILEEENTALKTENLSLKPRVEEVPLEESPV